MPVQSQKVRKRRYAAPIGGAFIVLAIIGVITVVVVSIRMTSTFLDNTREKEEFEELIRPVAMFDPIPFEDPKDIEMTSLLRYSLYATLKSDKGSQYEFDDFSELVVPASDLDVAATRLFGSEIQLEHQTFIEDNENSYVYDEMEGTYRVPTTVVLYVYRPEVMEITKDGDFLRLIVGYVPPETAMTDSAKAEKYMVFVIRKAGDSYQIAKVQNASEEWNQTLDGQVNAQSNAS